MMSRKITVLLASLMAVSAALVFTFYTFGAQGVIDMRAPLSAVADRMGQSAEPSVIGEIPAASNCRYGVGYVPDFSDSLGWVPTLDAGWYINFSAQTWGQQVNSASFAPVVRLRQDRGPNGERLPTFKFNPPLSYQYRDANGVLQKGLGSLISENPGHYWIVGNEVDVNNDVQDNMMPEVYARAYHEAYNFIKKADPTAKVANAGLSMITPGRLQYLSIVWDTYQATFGQPMPVDIWNMHLYILEERAPGNLLDYGDGKIALGTDPALAKLTSFGDPQYCPALGAEDIPANDPRADVYCRSEHDSVRIFREQIYGMRQWMKDRGQQNKPLLISEYSLLYPYLDGQTGGTCEFLQDEHQQCFYPERVTEFLRDTVKFMEETKDSNLGYPADENRLVQQWLWYSIVTEPEWSGGSSNLIVRQYEGFTPGDPAALTPMGLAFQQEATARVGQSNLVGGVARDITTFIRQPASTASAVLTASFRNGGTRSIVDPVTITFYSDAGLTQVIGAAQYNPADKGAITGCTWDGRNSEHVSILWNNLPVGTHQYWARIDSANAVGETNEGDNVTTKGTVTVLSNGLLIPVVNR